MFDPTRPPAVPIPAASVILVRDGARGAEVLLVKRSGRSGFMSSSFVFPGGKVDAGEPTALAALRELFEEAGVLLAAGTRPDAARTAALRKVEGPFAAVLADAGLAPEVDALRYWARWITPSAEPKRFDATFFVAALPGGQEASVDDHEAIELAWVTPAEGLARHAAGDAAFRLPPPQLWTLTELVAAGPTAREILDASAARAAHPVMPRFCEQNGTIVLLLPWDPEYASRGIGEGEPWPPAAPRGIPESRVVLDGQTWRLARP